MRTWTTSNRRPAEQYGYWREVICEAFTALDPIAHPDNGFQSDVRLKEFLDVTVSDVESKAQTIVRGSHEISRTPTEYFFANLQLSGNCVVRQDGREALIRPGDFYIVDTTRVYDLAFEDWRIVCIRIPRHILLPLLKAPMDSTAVRICGNEGLGTVVTSFLQSLCRCPDTIEPHAKAVLVSNLVNLLAVALGATVEAKERGNAAVRRSMRNAIVGHIENNIANPDLSVAGVAARFRISPRYLHKLFEDAGQSFGQIVLEKRLGHCAADLVQGTAAPCISEIAYRWGFGDLSHFCRAFRRRYGVSASAFREMNQGVTLDARSPAAATERRTG